MSDEECKDIDTNIMIKDFEFNSEYIENYFTNNLSEMYFILDFYNRVLVSYSKKNYAIVKWAAINEQHINKSFCNLSCFRKILLDNTSNFYNLVCAATQFKKWFEQNKIIKRGQIYNKYKCFCPFRYTPCIYT